jgi:hypothetical protein
MAYLADGDQLWTIRHKYYIRLIVGILLYELQHVLRKHNILPESILAWPAVCRS